MFPFKSPVAAYTVFAALALLCALILAASDPPYPHPSQAESLALTSLLPVLALGALGVWLWSRTPLATRHAAQSPKSLVVQPLLLGLALGLVAVGLDASLGLSKTIAAALGVEAIHLPLPYSIAAYLAAAVAVEVLFRLLPMGVVLYLGSKLSTGARWLLGLFVVMAVLTALIEPASQVPLLASRPPVLALTAGFIFLYGLIAAWQLWRAGPVAPIVMRLAFYSVWHVALGPLLTAA